MLRRLIGIDRIFGDMADCDALSQAAHAATRNTLADNVNRQDACGFCLSTREHRQRTVWFSRNKSMGSQLSTIRQARRTCSVGTLAFVSQGGI
jgi:hypothetical protein